MTIFSKIIAGEIPSYKIAENENFYAFLDIFPLAKGHVLVVPKTETDCFFDLGKNYLEEILVFAKPIANAIEKALELQRRFIPNKIIAASTWPTAAIALLAGKQGAADAMIYRCQDYTCHKPVVSLEAFWDIPT